MRMECETGTQSTIETTSSTAQTNRPDALRNQWCQTRPRDSDELDLKEVLGSEEIKEELKNTEPLVNLCLQQNDLYNAFDDCWTALVSNKTYTIFFN